MLWLTITLRFQVIRGQVASYSPELRSRLTRLRASELAANGETRKPTRSQPVAEADATTRARHATVNTQPFWLPSAPAPLRDLRPCRCRSGKTSPSRR